MLEKLSWMKRIVDGKTNQTNLNAKQERSQENVRRLNFDVVDHELNGLLLTIE